VKNHLSFVSTPFLFTLTILSFSTTPAPATPPTCRPSAILTDPLPSWNDGPAKQAILDFVKTSTDKSDPEVVPPEDCIATFDQDGTTWVEQPIYSQVLFAFDRVAELAPEYPEWKMRPLFKAIVGGDREAMAKFTLKDLEVIAMATHTGMTVDTFQG
jgi:hypothetical protein